MSVDVFYAPHADDEAIAMAGAMCHAKAEGRRVVLVMVTDSSPSQRAKDLFAERLRCLWHAGEKHALAHVDLRLARLSEFIDAGTRLGADEIALLEIPESLAHEDYPRFVDAIGFSLQRYETMYPGATHHVVSGTEVHAETDAGNIAHRGLAEAARRIPALCGRLHFHRVYVYSHPREARTAQQIVTLSPAAMDRKRQALQAYRVWAPDLGRFAFGYHSAAELIDAAGEDPREFVDLAE